jgi:hypothetical protein
MFSAIQAGDSDQYGAQKMRPFFKFLLVCAFIIVLGCGRIYAQGLGVGGAGPIYPVWTPVAASSLIAKAQDGWFYGFEGTSSVAGYFMLFDSATVPADGTVSPMECYAASAGQTVATGFLNNIKMNSGITIVFSSASNCFTKTASATAHISAQVR